VREVALPGEIHRHARLRGGLNDLTGGNPPLFMDFRKVWEPWEIQRLANELQSRFVGVSRSGNPLLELELIRETPLNEHYRPALNLARLVLEGIAVAHVAGSFEAAAFLVDMNYLYERWIGHELRQRLWPTMLVSEQELLPLSRKPTVRMNPDLMFRVGGSVSLVGDIKYKLTGSGMARNSDYYQLLAYATAAGLESGVLIYCQADEAPARTITVENSGRQLTCYPLSLAGDWNQVTSEVENLVRTVRILAGQAIATF